MAEVFLAREPLAQGLAKILVIKKIHPSLAETPQFRQMFEDEAKIAVNLNHPNIVQTFSYGHIQEAAGEIYYLVMEHVEGIDLLRLLNANPPIRRCRAKRRRGIAIRAQVRSRLTAEMTAAGVNRDAVP